MSDEAILKVKLRARYFDIFSLLSRLEPTNFTEVSQILKLSNILQISTIDITIENNPNFSTPRVLPIIRRVNADSIPPTTFAAPRILKLFINLLARSL